nr:unnamed protein product [Callosobruchus chinensis]
MLEEDYPKLLKSYNTLIKKLKYDCFRYDSKVLKKLESSYLSTSLAKMLDPTQSMFSGETAIPSHDHIDSLIRIVTGELSIALVEENLSEQVSKNVAKCIKMFAVKVEQQVESGPEAAQVIGGAPNMGQQKNVNLANSLHYLQLQVQRMLSNMKESLTDPCVKIINDSLKALNDLTAAIIQPLIASMNSVIETIIVTIHLESDWAKLNIPPNKHYHSCSPYMKELNEFVTRAYNIYLAKFENKDVLTSKCGDICMRTIELFIRHSSLLRPLSQGGRIRLQSDYQHLENTLKLIYPQLADLAQPYRLLKSMATLITLSPEEIVSRQMQGSCIPDSTVLFTLFAFAGSDLASPHQNTSWSLPKLSAWLDEHKSEADRLDLIAGALQKYEQIVRQKESDKYDPVYPIMSQFLEHAVKQSA